jgi:hypothetical protein
MTDCICGHALGAIHPQSGRCIMPGCSCTRFQEAIVNTTIAIRSIIRRTDVEQDNDGKWKVITRFWREGQNERSFFSMVTAEGLSERKARALLTNTRELLDVVAVQHLGHITR